MSILKKIKEKLIYGLEDSLMNFIDEDLTTVLELKKNGIQYGIGRLLSSKNFKDINLLAYAVMLRSDNKDIKEKLAFKNFEVFHECFKINNSITFHNVIQKYFEPENIQDFKVINSISDIDYTIIPINMDDLKISDFEVLAISRQLYKNPYTNSTVKLESNGDYSNITTNRDSENRSLTSIVNISMYNQLKILDNTDKTYSGLINNFSLNEINKFEVEFALFHELAHASVSQLHKKDRVDESISDLCGTIRVIKNNNMTLDQAVDYIDHRISFRSQESVLRFHSTKFDENDIENKRDIRIHATQLSLLTLKDLVQKDYEFIQELSTNEEIIVASNLSRFSTNSRTLKAIKEKEFFNKTLLEEISLDTWIKNEKFSDFFEKVALERKTTKEELIENLKNNISGNTDKIFDVMTAFYLMTSPNQLKELETYTIMAAELTRNMLIHERESAIDVNLNVNFSDKDVKSVIEKQKNSPSKLFSM